MSTSSRSSGSGSGTIASSVPGVSSGSRAVVGPTVGVGIPLPAGAAAVVAGAGAAAEGDWICQDPE
jgi:hypothetical protein